MTTVIFDRHFCAAHRVSTDPGACQRVHGHNYHIKVEVEGDVNDESGFVVAFDEVKKIIDQFDHRLILAEDDSLRLGFVYDATIAVDGDSEGFGPPRDWIVRVPNTPSTENLAQYIADEVKALAETIWCVYVELTETPGITARAYV